MLICDVVRQLVVIDSVIIVSKAETPVCMQIDSMCFSCVLRAEMSWHRIY